MSKRSYFFTKIMKELNCTNNDLKRKHLPKKNKYLKALYYKEFTKHVIKYVEYRRKIIDDSITYLD